MVSKLTPQQRMDKFVQTYSDLYTDISEYSSQDELPLTLWVLGSDFKKTTSYELRNNNPSKNPFSLVKNIIIKEKPTAYVMGGTAVAVKKVIETGKSTNTEIDSKWTDDSPLGGIIGTNDPAAANFSYEDVINDPNKIESIVIASSVIDLQSKVQFADSELMTKDNLTMYIVNRTSNGVTLTVESDSGIDKIGSNNLVNVQGKKFGLRRK